MSAAVSVVMATYNGATYLREQLDTLLADLHGQDEVVVVDDCSSDDTPQILREWSDRDRRLRLVLRDTNQGVRISFQDGLRAALNDVVFLCDQDDRWLPGKRDALLACFRADPKCLVALSDAQLIDSTGRVWAESFMARRGGFRASVLSTLIRNRYLGCTMAMHRSLIDMALPIPRMAPMHDMWFGGMAVVWGTVAYVDRPLIQYRRHDANVTPAGHQSLRQMAVWRIQLLACLAMRTLSLVWRRRNLERRADPADGRG